VSRFAAALWARLSWKNVLATQLIAQGIVGVEAFESSGPIFGTWLGHPELSFVSASLCAACLLPLALAADVLVERGTRAQRAFPLAMLLAFPTTWGVDWAAQRCYEIAAHRHPASVQQEFAFVSSALDLAFIGAFCMLVYMNRRIADRMLEGVRHAELKRLKQEQELVNSRLATAEAQIDPQELMDALAAIRRGFESSPAEADARLDQLVQRLRNALRRTTIANDAGSST
jgi:hypothetical protein